MPTTRRELLRLGLGGSTLLSCGTTVPTFLARSARALDDGSGSQPDRPILVVVQLEGGNDGLNTVVPHADDIYQRSRPRLALKAKALHAIDDHVGLHPSLDSLAPLLEDGRLAIVQSVGYPNPNRSHFESTAIWQTAHLEPALESSGWLARSLDAAPTIDGNDAPAMHIGDEALPQALRGGRQHVPSLSRIEEFRRRLGPPNSIGADEQRTALDAIAARGRDSANPLLQFVARNSLVSYASSARLEEILRDEPGLNGYPEQYPLARQLGVIARLIRAGLDTSIYYARLGGFDTHADQRDRHASLLGQLGGSLRAFLDDLDRSGLGDRVTVLVFSEFGRRLRENDSGGTDHGTSAPVLLLGRPVEAGLYGTHPDLSDLKDGDPKHAIDFRRLYATLLKDWLGIPPTPVLGDGFDPLPLLST